MHSSFMISFSLHVSVKIIKREGFFQSGHPTNNLLSFASLSRVYSDGMFAEIRPTLVFQQIQRGVHHTLCYDGHLHWLYLICYMQATITSPCDHPSSVILPSGLVLFNVSTLFAHRIHA
jgi:hypothetical protein